MSKGAAEKPAIDFTPAEMGFIGQAVERLVDQLHADVRNGELNQWRDAKERERVLTYLYIGDQLRRKLFDYWRSR